MIDESVVERTQERLGGIAADLVDYLNDPTRAADIFFGAGLGVLVARYGRKAAVDRLLHLAAGLERMASHHGGAPEC